MNRSIHSCIATANVYKSPALKHKYFKKILENAITSNVAIILSCTLFTSDQWLRNTIRYLWISPTMLLL